MFGQRFILSLLALICLLVITSCSVEKRRYTKGYHVEWNKNHHQEKQFYSIADPWSESLNDQALFIVKEEIEDLQHEEIAMEVDAQPEMLQTALGEQIVTKQKKSASYTDKSPASVIAPWHAVSSMRAKGSLAKPASSGGAARVVSLIALGVAILSVLLMIAAFVVQGWTALGLLALSFVVALITAVLTLIGWQLYRHSDTRAPGYLWFCAVVGGLGLYLLFLILRGR